MAVDTFHRNTLHYQPNPNYFGIMAEAEAGGKALNQYGKRGRSPSPLGRKARRLDVEIADEKYRLPFGWIEGKDLSSEGTPDGEMFFENLATGSKVRRRPTRGVWSERAVSKMGQRHLVGEERIVRPMMEKAQTFPERQNVPEILNTLDPRRIPRPDYPPSLGSRKWLPSFSHLYEYKNCSGRR